MIINCIAIEDEPLALKKIKGFINQVEYLNLLKGFDNAIDAIGFLKINSVDLIFLDIRMKKLSGLQFLESLHSKPKVIITSAYNEYALKGYELDITDYLLKPFTFERFLKSVDKSYNQLNKVFNSDHKSFFFVKTEYRIEKIIFEDILFIRGMKDYLQIHTIERKIMILKTFKSILEILPESTFLRVHNSFIVSISKIETIERNRIKIGKELIPISESYRDSFFSILKKKKLLL